ncbi:hypothetical protein ACFV9C_17800 [Kribbella sp. NPDC059898]|uniref:hypothetical protein n=1 Tax=Kribbella sp. NPDC059898 TaxID=3346995 RepID=UPI003649B809
MGVQIAERAAANFVATPEWERLFAQINKQAAASLASPGWDRLRTRVNEHAAASLASPEWDRLRARINEQTGTTLAALGTQITERAAANFVATPEWERLFAQINKQAAAALASADWERLNALIDARAATDTQSTDADLTELAATPEWERIVEEVAAADAPEPSAPTDPSIPRAVITATMFVAVYGILLTLYFNAFEGTDDYLLKGNWVERVELVGYALGHISLEIAHRLTPKP